MLSIGGVLNLLGRQRAKYQLLPTYPGNDDRDGNSEGTEADDDEFAEHLSLRLTLSRTSGAEVKFDRPRGEILLVVLEELAILSVLGIYTTRAVTGVHQDHKYEQIGSWSGLATWVSTISTSHARAVI